jgi:DNA-binding SARP family transcriptional activator/tetratricopeptide (TPR) repeat protein
MRGLALRLLGSPQVTLDGSAVSFDTRKAIALLAYLACTGRPHTRGALATLLWPEYADARNALRRTLSTLQHALGPGWLETGREQVSLVERPDLWLDVVAFEAQSGSAADTAALAAGLALYRDDFLAGFTLRDSLAFDEWQLFEAERLRQRLALGLERLVELHIAAGQHSAAIEPARRRLALDPLHEPTHRTLMRLYAATGQRTAAVRQFRTCAQRLEQEFGAPPADETVQLYQELHASAVAVGTAATSASHASRQMHATAAAAQLPATMFVGRDGELARLCAHYAAGTGGLIALTGQAGIGKTRLAEELLGVAHSAGSVILAARCYEGESALAYAPVAALLRAAVGALERADRLQMLDATQLAEVARLVPELSRQVALPETQPLAGPEARRRFFEAVVELIVAACAGPAAGVIVVDDAHWADSASLDLLAFVARRLPERPALLLLLAWRDEEVPADHQLRAILAEQRRAGRAELIALAPLGPDDVADLARAGGAPLAPALAARLHQESEGLPLLVVEYLAMLREQGPPIDDRSWPLPGRARDLLEARLRPLDEQARALISAAAVLGRAFDLPTLCATTALAEPAAVDGLELLLGRGLLVEASAAPLRFAFSHDRLRALVYDRLSRARRGLLHRRVAAHLAAQLVATPRLGLADQVAYHAAAAGERDLAAAHHRVAGDDARLLAANSEAAAHYAAALELGHPEAGTLREALGDLLALAGDYAGALAQYDAARTVPDAGRAVARKAGELHHRLGAWDAAEALFAAALDDREASVAERALASAAWSLTARRRGDAARAAALADEALRLGEASGEPRALARAYGAAGSLAAEQGEHATALAHLERGLALAEQLDDPETLVAALNRLALALAASDPDRAAALAERALALCLARDDRHRAAALHNTLADLRHAAGDGAAARTHLREAVTLFAAIGHDQPAIWMLTEW